MAFALRKQALNISQRDLAFAVRTFSSTPLANAIFRKKDRPTGPPTLETPGAAGLRLQRKPGEQSLNPDGWVFKTLLWLTPKLGYFTKNGISISACRELYAVCAEMGALDGRFPACRDFFYQDCKLTPSLTTWFQITQIHVWMLLVRIRALPIDQKKRYSQRLVDYYFEDVEMRIRGQYKITSGRVATTMLKDYYDQFRGSTLAYDEALMKDDTVFAAALWRNVFQTTERPDLPALSELRLSDDEVVNGMVTWQLPDRTRVHAIQRGELPAEV
ncbi:Serine carboxypeptidase 3 [Saitoella coloradoensis]